MSDDVAAPLVGPTVESDASLREAEETLAAIRADQVDAFVVHEPAGHRVVLTDRGVERPYRAMVDGMSEGAATVALDGTVLYANRRLAAMLHVPGDRIVATSLSAYVDAGDRHVLHAALASGATIDWRGEVRLRAADGGIVPVLLSSTSLDIGDAGVVLSLLFTDLRDQKRTDEIVAAGRLAEHILDQASEAIVVCDADGTVVKFNPQALRLTGGRDPSGQRFADAFPLQFCESELTMEELLTGASTSRPVRLATADGEFRLNVSASRLTGPDAGDMGAVVTLTDVTDLQLATERLERHSVRQALAARLGKAALRGAPLVELAQACRRALMEQFDAASVVATGSLADREDQRESAAPGHDGVVRCPVQANGTICGELVVDLGPGRTFSSDDVDFLDHLRSLLSLAAEQHVLEARLRHKAHHDDLTGLPNRVLLEDRLGHSMAQAARDGSAVAVMFVDLDRFKAINDTLGHQAGNEVLVQIAERLSGRVRESDTVARLGGDEFVLVHGGLKGADDAHEVARAIVLALGQPFHVAGHAVKVRATVGVSTYPYDGTEIEALISKADRAMYYGKRGGRNSVQFFTAAMNEFSTAQLEMEHDLQAALADGDLELHFQPQLSPHTNELRGFEALARWKHPRHGWIPPTRFVPVAEEMGLIVELGAWALHEACHQAARWTHASGRGVRVSVNISPNHFARTDFFDSVEAALHSSGLPANHLELEVTESIMMNDIATVTRVLAALRRRGVQIALDDFGLGYSSVSYLRILPLDRIKIDKSFLDADDDQPNAGHDQLSVLSAVATMAQALGLRVTLEGIETPHHLRMARAVGCDEVQGHLFGRPIPGPKVADMLAQWPRQAQRR